METGQYHFFLGRNQYISLAEIEAVFGKEPARLRSNVALIDDLEDDKVLASQKILGGTIKTAEVLGTCEENELNDAILEVLESERKEGRKTVLALNYYGKRDEKKFLKNHLMGVKKRANFSLRFCNGNFKNVQSVVTFKEIIRKRNIELNVVELERGRLQVSQTITCQNIDNYSQRDYDKPGRDAKVGMLPPKLAQILLNLAGEPKIVWDPFCGTGTVLMEGLLAGKNMVGSDLSEKMLDLTNKNLDWFKQQKQAENIDTEYKVFQNNAAKFVKVEADAVVSEGYLGEPKRQMPKPIELQKTDNELTEIYGPFLDVCRRNKVKTVVMCLPAYKMEEGVGFMKKTLARMQQSGYNLAALSETRDTLLYKRDNQFVFREIVKLTLK